MSGEMSTPTRLFVDWGKLVTMLVAIVASSVLAALEVASQDLPVIVITAVVSYTFGNGVQARKGIGPQPLIGAAPVVGPSPGVATVTDGDEPGGQPLEP